ncbi:MAG TPA: hypothetical protein VFU56_02515 [Gaiellaceae bacterium]|nr:hypothetical protein [Gaiellaceae bacterium]
MIRSLRFTIVKSDGPGSLRRITAWEGIADKIDCSPDGTAATERICAGSPTRRAAR